MELGCGVVRVLSVEAELHYVSRIAQDDEKCSGRQAALHSDGKLIKSRKCLVSQSISCRGRHAWTYAGDFLAQYCLGLLTFAVKIDDVFATFDKFCVSDNFDSV